MEEPNLTPEGSKSIESYSDKNNKIIDEDNLKSISKNTDLNIKNKDSEDQSNLESKEQIPESNEKSLFKRFLNDGFDGISTNPNYKMLALLIILLINLSLFFVIGNIGKAFLRNAGIMG